MAVSDLLDENEAAPEDIGATLRGAREAAGYSIADVAERLRLSRHHIENLEAERFDLFPVSVFLRGYLTSYARLLRIDSEPLLEAYDRRGFGPPQLHSQDTAPSAPRGSEFTVTVTTLIVIAVLIVLSALWWREQWTEDAGLPGVTVERPGEEGAPGASGEGPGEPAEPPGASDETAPEEPPGPEAATDDPGVEPPPVRAGTEPPADDAAPGALEPVETVPAAEADADTEAVAVAVAVAGTAPAPGADAEAPAERAPDQGAERPAAGVPGELATLIIRVHEDCWLMIRDADQRLIFRDLASAGTVLDLSAVPPIRIVAGYAEGIEIEYNGEPIDLSPHVEQDTGTARFRLGS